jgi:amino acid transporter
MERRPVEEAAAPRLQANVIGPWGLAALVIGVTSPAIGLYATWGPIEATAGPVAPLVFLAALAITLPTVLSYASLSRHAPSAGAAAAWLWTTVNPTTGLIAGLVMMIYFVMTAISVPLLFGLFFRDFVDWMHVTTSGMAAWLIGLVLQSGAIAWIWIYIASVQGASRIIFALARHRLLPAAFARLEGEKRVPRAAVLFVVLTCIAMGLLSLALLRNGLDSFVWWSNALVFFAALTFTGVNIANLLYFWRILPRHFNIVRNLLVPVAGVFLNLYLIYAAFFSSLWSAPFRTGRSIVIVCVALFALLLLVAAYVRLFRRDLLAGSAPIGVA